DRDDLYRLIPIGRRPVADLAFAVVTPARDRSAGAPRARVISPERELYSVADSDDVDRLRRPGRLRRAFSELAKVVVTPALDAPVRSASAGVLPARRDLDGVRDAGHLDG